MAKAKTHLYWGYTKPWLFKGVSIGITTCGLKLPRAEISVFRDDVDCKECLDKGPALPVCVRPATAKDIKRY